MKDYVGENADSGIVHSLETTSAKTHDYLISDELRHGEETSVWVDKGYVYAGRETVFTKDGKTFWGVVRKAPKGGEIDDLGG